MSGKNIDVIIPDLGDESSMMTLVEWLVKVGDQVDAGDLLYAVETDKAVFEVESDVRGKVSEILATVGEAVSADQAVAKIMVVEQ